MGVDAEMYSWTLFVHSWLRWAVLAVGAWKRQGTTVDNLTKELRLALQYPEGAAG